MIGLKGRIPKADDILDRGIKKLIEETGVRSIDELFKKISLGELLTKIEEKAEEIYRQEEKKVIREILLQNGIPPDIVERVMEIFIDKGLATSIANTRRARAGSTAESILRTLLNKLGIPCEKCNVEIEGYRPDIVVPSNEVLRKSPEKAVAIAVKRTLRERWAEDTDVFRKFKHGKFVLLTYDPDFNEEKVKDMISRNMQEIYIPDKLYEDNIAFVTKYTQVRRHSQLPGDIMKLIENWSG